MKIKNIIFDLGGVILNLDQDKTLRAFKRLGADLDELNEKLSIFKDFETGKIAAEFFMQTIFTGLKGNVSHAEIADAWNSMLLDLPPERIELLKKLKSRYRLFMLSNTNSLHIDDIYRVHGREVFEPLFEKIYLSHEIGLRKPDLDCYQYVLKDAGIIAGETVFIDDNKINIQGAELAGLKCIWAKVPLDTWFEQELKALEIMPIN